MIRALRSLRISLNAHHKATRMRRRIESELHSQVLSSIDLGEIPTCVTLSHQRRGRLWEASRKSGVGSWMDSRFGDLCFLELRLPPARVDTDRRWRRRRRRSLSPPALKDGQPLAHQAPKRAESRITKRTILSGVTMMMQSRPLEGLSRSPRHADDVEGEEEYMNNS